MLFIRLIVNFFVIMLYFNCSAQNTEWVLSFGGNESDKGINIGTDSLGYIYISGWYNTSADFGSFNLTESFPPPPSAPNSTLTTLPVFGFLV